MVGEATSQAVEVRLGTPISVVPGVGAKRGRCLTRLGIRTVSDLLRHLPLRYEKHYAEGNINDLPSDGVGSARGTIVATRVMPAFGRGGKARFQATLTDHAATLALIWFNAAYLRDKIHPGMVVRVNGKVSCFRGYAQMVNPKWEELGQPDATPAADARLRPVYPATEDLPSAVIERLVGEVLAGVLPQLSDPLPEELVRGRHMPALAEAFRMAHQPGDEEEAGAARRRLAYNEFLLLQLGIALKRAFNQTALQAPALRWSQAIERHVRARFPFTLTPAQERVIGEIAGDLQKTEPMNRLLQGDVGSGKTVVALYALLLAVADRKQGAIMTPTELLAEQHYGSISAMLAGSNVRIALLTGQRRSNGTERAQLLARIERGEVDIVVGTQAILTEAVRFHDLAVVVVDEQHRFGVLQRAAIRVKSGAGESPRKSDANRPRATAGAPSPPPSSRLAPGAGAERMASPHYLVMTATPIPRTLSLTVFGDLDISTIDKLPPGRTPIATRVVGPEKADEVYRYVAQRVAQGEQAYVVVPTIDDAGHESAAQLKSLHSHVQLLQDKFCRGLKVAAVHGRLQAETRAQIMGKFRAGQVQVLVATTVIEVGVDVPNATIMVVEHAERFGLAQLHQLRGRVGRGTHGAKSLCVFIGRPVTEEAQKRLAAIVATTDGFKIAEADLQIRGMGDFFGTRQHGLPPLRVARIPEDLPLLQLARRDAQSMVQADPHLAAPGYQRLRKVLLQQYGESLGLIDVG